MNNNRFSVLFCNLLFLSFFIPVTAHSALLQQTWTFEGFTISGSHFKNGVRLSWDLGDTSTLLTDGKIIFSSSYDTNDTSVSRYEDPTGEDASNNLPELIVETYNAGDSGVDEAQDMTINFNTGTLLTDFYNWYSPMGFTGILIESMLPYYNDIYFGARLKNGVSVTYEYESLNSNLFLSSTSDIVDTFMASFLLTNQNVSFDPNDYREVYFNWNGTYTVTEEVQNDGSDRGSPREDLNNEPRDSATVSAPASFSYILLFLTFLVFIKSKHIIT